MKVADIQRAVSDYYGVSLSELKSDSRLRSTMRARHVAMLLSSELTKRSSVKIGHLFNRDHSTVLEAIRSVKRRQSEDPELRTELLSLRFRLFELAES